MLYRIWEQTGPNSDPDCCVQHMPRCVTDAHTKARIHGEQSTPTCGFLESWQINCFGYIQGYPPGQTKTQTLPSLTQLVTHVLPPPSLTHSSCVGEARPWHTGTYICGVRQQRAPITTLWPWKCHGSRLSHAQLCTPYGFTSPSLMQLNWNCVGHVFQLHAKTTGSTDSKYLLPMKKRRVA